MTKDFKLRYRRSVLGVIWSVLNPLLMMMIMSFVFSYFLRGSNVENYPLYLIVGNITFSLMSEATNGGLTSIISAAPPETKGAAKEAPPRCSRRSRSTAGCSRSRRSSPR